MLNLIAADNHAEVQPQFSPLVLSDRLITLAQAADQAGLPVVAKRLVHLALAACTPVKYRAH